MIAPLVPRLGAIAIVIRPGDVLLVQRRNPPDAGLWGFPGGHVNWGETALAAAARELREETGVIATPIDYLTNIDLIRPLIAGKLIVSTAMQKEVDRVSAALVLRQ